MAASDQPTVALQKLRDDLVVRARGFAAHPGLFVGRTVSEELAVWVRRLDEVINNDES